MLTWRSIVNRVWQYHFGAGLVDSANDFGHMGSPPTHPELLDWLAVTFRDQGGSLKQLHKLILMSATYRQQSANIPANATVDADNRYLWRMNRQRLDAESVRDAVLAVSGKLDLTMGGPRPSSSGSRTITRRSTITRASTSTARPATGAASTASSCAACRIRSWTVWIVPTRR